jgi:RimJ/RimL family protein N-acetyltransferase
MSATTHHALTTDRLRLRQWCDQDTDAFAELNADPQVMAHFPNTMTQEESDSAVARYRRHIEHNGWGFWALERRDTGAFIGMAGINRPDYPLPCGPCMEVGWRLHRTAWGFGYATEAAEAALEHAFGPLACDAVYAFTAVSNSRSAAVMKRLGMVDTRQNFAHPKIAADSPVSEHVLYALTQENWEKRHAISR